MKRRLLLLLALGLLTSSFNRPAFTSASKAKKFNTKAIQALHAIQAFNNSYAFKGPKTSSTYCYENKDFIWCMMDIYAPDVVNYELMTGAVCDPCLRCTQLCNAFPGYSFGYRHSSNGPPPPGPYCYVNEVASMNYYGEQVYVYIYSDMSGYPMYP